MFNSVALNVVIGLVFIYLLYSLLATTINEGVASVFNLRAQKLEKAITRMLNDGIMHHHNIWTFLGDFFADIARRIWAFLLLFAFIDRKSVRKESLVDEFYNHPAIKYLGENKISNKPSYISPEFFSKAVMDILKNKATNPDDPALKRIQEGLGKIHSSNETKQFLQSLLADSNNDLDKFKTALEQWFNETMNRTSGWYKKQSQKITFVIGFVLAICFNVDTVSIVKKLSNDPEAAQSLSDVATQYVQIHKDSTGHLTPKEDSTATLLFAEAKKQVNGDIANANSIIGLGWNIPSDLNNSCTVDRNALNTPSDTINCRNCAESLHGWPFVEGKTTITVFGKAKYVICLAFSSWRRILGYLLTALAISFGAPFWFDLLNRFVQLRGSGKKPEEPALKNTNDETVTVKRVG